MASGPTFVLPLTHCVLLELAGDYDESDCGGTDLGTSRCDT